jgi:hypothetical protein
MKKKKRARERRKQTDQTRFSSFIDLIFVPFVFPLRTFRSLKYSIGTMAKIKKTKNDIEFLFGSLNEKKGQSTCVSTKSRCKVEDRLFIF